MKLFENIEGNRRKVCMVALIFSVVSLIGAVAMSDFYTALVNIILWVCMCFGYSWARSSKIIIDGILGCVYAVSFWQIAMRYFNGEVLPVIPTQLIISVIFNFVQPIIEIIIIYKSKEISEYFIEVKKNKINIKR